MSERVRFDDNVSFITPQNFESSLAEKSSIDSSSSFKRTNKPPLNRSDKAYDTLSNDSIYVDITLPYCDEKPRKTMSTAATLRSIFFHSNLNDSKPTKGFEDRVIIEVSNETLDKQLTPSENKPVDTNTSNILTTKPVSLNCDSSTLL